MSLTHFKENVINIFVVIFITFLYFIYIFYYTFSFNFLVGVDWVFLLFPMCISFFLVAGISKVFKGEEISATALDVVVYVLLLTYCLSILFSNSNADLFNEQKSNLIIAAIIYSLLRLGNKQVMIKVIFSLLAIFFLIELYFGYRDFFLMLIAQALL